VIWFSDAWFVFMYTANTEFDQNQFKYSRVRWHYSSKFAQQFRKIYDWNKKSVDGYIKWQATVNLIPTSEADGSSASQQIPTFVQP
jgi:hypothetical protein